MNEAIAKAAEKGILSGPFDQTKGFCLRVTRQAVEVVDGTKYDWLFRGDGKVFTKAPYNMPLKEAQRRDATATRSAHRFLARGLGFEWKDLAKHGGLQPGDIVFKTNVAPNRWGDYSGHVGIVCMDGKRIAENSSTSIGRKRGALGFRTIEQFKGSTGIDIVVRLPEKEGYRIPAPVASPKKPRTLAFSINDKVYDVPGAVEEDGHFRDDVVNTIGALQLAYATNQAKTTPDRLVLNVFNKPK